MRRRKRKGDTKRLMSCWPRLSPEDQEILSLRYVLELAPADVSGCLKKTVNAVYTQSSRARGRLLQLYMEDENDESIV